MTWRTTDCNENCWKVVYCTRCKLAKAPKGRSVPLEAANGYCHCPGYDEPPEPGHLWPEEKGKP